MPELLEEYSGKVVRTTDLAVCVDVGGDENIWLPKSQLGEEGDINGESDLGDEGSFFIPEWLAIEKNLE